MSVEFKAVRSESAASQIAAQIRESIVSGKLKVDQRLPTEEELAQQFSVSRPTVREALKILGAQNLIRSRRGSSGGTFITLPDSADIREQLYSITSGYRILCIRCPVSYATRTSYSEFGSQISYGSCF